MELWIPLHVCENFVDEFEYAIGYLFSLPRFASFHHLTGRLHRFLVEISDNFGESHTQLRLALDEILWCELGEN